MTRETSWRTDTAMEGEEHDIVLACVISGTLFALLGSSSFSILWAVNWRPWRLYSWIFARKWPDIFQGPQLGVICGALTLFAWTVVVSPLMVLVAWGSWLLVVLERDLIGLAVIMAGSALLLAFYAIMLWWRTQWQSSNTIRKLYGALSFHTSWFLGISPGGVGDSSQWILHSKIRRLLF
ncbi:hypothetical protein Cgig2_016888 [Carnegiea gigantea]|uniref:Uncharacterized protein n=1 Tax=Carnegiea gigantea TaxID=171969 RepID=A0A9Q1QDX8_9CARY|nr:hypothetical protein Cgig2_016888 [Carnegiea gigantea]